MTYCGRFAPSPTGMLHLGGLATAIFCAAAAKKENGRLILRMDDLDQARVKPQCEEFILNNLRVMGIEWDEGPDKSGDHGPYRQSERAQYYEIALRALIEQGRTYYCDCSRSDLQRVASAPHASDEGIIYSGRCRCHGMRVRAFRRAPAIRLAVPQDAEIVFEDAVLGLQKINVAQVCGDFVLRRGDGVFSYQLASIVDDIAMGVTQVVRGADLLISGARQVLLAQLLGAQAPGFAHIPLVVEADGQRLSKRYRSTRVSQFHPSIRVTQIVRAYGFSVTDSENPIQQLANVLRFDALRKIPFVAVNSIVSTENIQCCDNE